MAALLQLFCYGKPLCFFLCSASEKIGTVGFDEEMTSGITQIWKLKINLIFYLKKKKRKDSQLSDREA